MAQCISPFYKKDTQMSFPCGKCPPCKMRRASGWSFRILKESERSDSALFLTLTYDNEHVPITKNGYLTLRKSDVQLFIKRLRTNTERSTKNTIWDRKIKYYAVGEYGTKGQRPHYHIIIFNAEYHNIEQSWTLGQVHYGDLTPASAMYTLKYISKSGIIPCHSKDDRQKEFSLMSKRLGDNYLSDRMKAWHKAHGFASIERYHLTVPGGIKIAMPRYYKQKIWDKIELQLIGAKFVKKLDDELSQKNSQELLDYYEKIEKVAAYHAFHNDETRDTTL